MEQYRAVRVQVRKTRREGYYTYSVTIPKEFAEELGIAKGTVLYVKIAELTVKGKKVRGVFYFKPI